VSVGEDLALAFAQCVHCFDPLQCPARDQRSCENWR
jgi:hypothetical protein